ncbi:DUF262 domain-containing protein [Helicobacter salomonis]|uniref:DUF262 domain-containing protein n=1 Tax=Helicobacter salomonis TaxID=56878 RepID=UPI000CF042CB|nr:DUF262 domain-containing protein [Helicobacter salomonis]
MSYGLDMQTIQMSILDYLSKNRFVIPEYQRPYIWKDEECVRLWEDITEFFKENGSEHAEQNPYFLGSVVIYPIQDKKHIIDGQQRTTTLMLLLKAMHAKLMASDNQNVQHLINKISSCLWDIDRKTGQPALQKSHLISHAISDEKHQVLQNILEKGLEQGKTADNSNYEKNYRYFCEQLDEFAKDDPTRFQDLCLCVLESCIVLSVECGGQDEERRLEYALRVFNTLNNRGTPLNDADIFKSVIYSYKQPQEREAFIEQWKSLEPLELNTKKGEGLTFLFRLYMHVLRAQDNVKSREIGLRPFFLEKKRVLLKNGSIMQGIEKMREYLYGNGEPHNYSLKSRQFIHVLEELDNEYWRYLDGAYYAYCSKNKKDYFEGHGEFAMRVCAHFLIHAISKNTPQIKDLTYNAYTSLYHNGSVNFPQNSYNILTGVIPAKGRKKEQTFRTYFEAAQTSKKLTKTLLTLHMYLKYPEQETEICEKSEIEHIFPKKWQPNYHKLNDKEASILVESIGNKILLEKPLNIKASNGYFEAKKAKYAKSQFLEAQELAKLTKSDWSLKDIKERTEEIYRYLYVFFKECAY